MKEKELLDLLDDDLVDAILEMSVEDALEGVTPEDLAQMTGNVSAAAAKVGRARLARSKAAAADAKFVRPAEPRYGAKALAEARANDAAFDKKLTLAARTGGPDFEADRVGIEEDLEELLEDEAQRADIEEALEKLQNDEERGDRS